MRVLYCSENYCPHDHRFLSAIVETGEHEVYWFRLEGGERVQEEREIPGAVKIVTRPSTKQVDWLDYFHIRREFASVIEQVKPDIIHAGPIQRVAFLAALNDFHPLVSMSWGFDMLEDANKNILWKTITRYVLNHSDWLIADCQTVRKMAARFGFTSNNVTVFPWGVDQKVFSPGNRKSAREKIGFKNDLLIVHTRSWEPRYGVDVALGGLKQSLDVHPNIQVLMLGGGSQVDEVKGFVENNSMSEHVHFLGYQSNENLVDYYRAADIYLSASHVDGSSVALLEAMSCGCVPIVSDIPSNLEWVSDGVEGWTFQDNSADDLARVMLEALNDREKMPAYRNLALQKVQTGADWENGKKQLLHTYQKALAL